MLSSIIDKSVVIYHANFEVILRSGVTDINNYTTFIAAKISINDFSVVGNEISYKSIKSIDIEAKETNNILIGKVCQIDTFGNLITNIGNNFIDVLYELQIGDF